MFSKPHGSQYELIVVEEGGKNLWTEREDNEMD